MFVSPNMVSFQIQERELFSTCSLWQVISCASAQTSQISCEVLVIWWDQTESPCCLRLFIMVLFPVRPATPTVTVSVCLTLMTPDGPACITLMDSFITTVTPPMILKCSSPHSRVVTAMFPGQHWVDHAALNLSYSSPSPVLPLRRTDASVYDVHHQQPINPLTEPDFRLCVYTHPKRCQSTWWCVVLL